MAFDHCLCVQRDACHLHSLCAYEGNLINVFFDEQVKKSTFSFSLL